MLFLSSDGGGTKLQLIAFNERLECVASYKGPAVTTIFMDKETPLRNLRSSLQKIISLLPEDTVRENGLPVIDGLFECGVLSGMHPHRFLDEMAVVRRTVTVEEMYGALLSAAFLHTGAVTLAGTGSNHTYIKDRKSEFFLGAYGPILGDEGSGYDLGRQAILAAIYDEEGRGEHTLLKDLVREEYRITGNIFSITDQVYPAPDTRLVITRATYCLAKAARENDPVACRILRDGGIRLAEDTAAMFRRIGDPACPITVNGGAWKIHPLLFSSYKAHLDKLLPNADFRKPAFDPAMFGVICYLLENGRSVNEETLSVLRRNFGDFSLKKYFE